MILNKHFTLISFHFLTFFPLKYVFSSFFLFNSNFLSSFHFLLFYLNINNSKFHFLQRVFKIFFPLLKLKFFSCTQKFQTNIFTHWHQKKGLCHWRLTLQMNQRRRGLFSSSEEEIGPILVSLLSSLFLGPTKLPQQNFGLAFLFSFTERPSTL